ncbi:MAG TPA: hypothetical protein VFC18_13275, partial [Burkholderiales bacterium]|nr:hypothetical protein [Burkholderiales bacterium]
MECFVGTPERDEGMSRTGGNGKAAQFGVARARQPGEERMTDAGAQRLLGRPERIVPAGGADHRELGEIGTGRGERRRVRAIWPQLAWGGRIPTPTKLIAASVKMAAGM